MGIPKDFQDLQLVTLDEAKATKLKGPHMTLSELAREIGWNQGE
jgi:hypothetical protein